LSSLSHNLNLAPHPKVVDGLLAVPVDIQQVDSHVIFDMSKRTAHVKSTVQFISGSRDGNPIFDLRQDILQAHLYKERFPIEMMQHHDFDGGHDAELRILDKVLPSGTENILTLIYDLNQPQCLHSQPIGWNPPRLYFEFWFSDLWPARYLEMWFPSNLIYDEFKFNLEIEIINTPVEHIAFSNGRIHAVGQNHWQIKFPQPFSSFSPMLCIIASDTVEYRQGIMTLPNNGERIHLDTFKLLETSDDLAAVEKNLKECIAENVRDVGPYIHGDRFTTFLWSDTGGRSMEYDGAVTSDFALLKHEIFHSWFARGLKPASQNDSWMDEGWTVYCTVDSSKISPFALSDPPVTLSSSNPFNRTTPSSPSGPDAYKDGSRLFASLASELGKKELQSYMAKFYRGNKGKGVTTLQLQSHLVKESGNKIIQEYFDRFVFGLRL
jgi:hypothetical protein